MILTKEQQLKVEENLGLVGKVIKDKVHCVLGYRNATLLGSTFDFCFVIRCCLETDHFFFLFVFDNIVLLCCRFRGY